MTPQANRVRRATLDDLPALREFWSRGLLPVDDLEKRFTEFQIVEGPAGEILAICGLYIQKQNGLLHSEVYASPEIEPEMRAALWQRLLVLAKNHGLTRVWTLSSVSFWREQGWKEPDFKTLEALPPIFGHPHAGWLYLPLRDESVISVEKEFEMFAQSQRENTERVLEQARTMKVAAYTLVVIVAAILIGVAIYTFIRLPRR